MTASFTNFPQWYLGWRGYSHNRAVIGLSCCILIRVSLNSCPDGPIVDQRWRHELETFSALLALYEEGPPVTGGFPSKRPVTQNFDVFFDMRLNKQLSKQSGRRWFETPWRSLWRHCNAETSHDFTGRNEIIPKLDKRMNCLCIYKVSFNKTRSSSL